MTTNLVAAVVVTLVTNVVPSNNAKWERDPFMSWPEGGGPMRIVKEPTESYLTTNITEHTTITVTLSDGPKTFTHDRLLSSVTAILKKQETWQASGIKTNTVVEIPGLWTNVVTGATNILMIGL